MQSALNALNFDAGSVVLIPASLCADAIQPYLNLNFKLVAYSLDSKLTLQIDSLYKCCDEFPVKVIHLVHYFGWKQDFTEIYKYAKVNNILIVEDKAHCMFHPGLDTDDEYCENKIVLYSLRKFFPLPDGAALRFPCDKIYNESVHQNTFNLKGLAALVYRSLGFEKYHNCEKLLKLLSSKKWMDISRSYENNEKNMSMSWLSYKIIEIINFDNVARTRRKNTRLLIDAANKSIWAKPMYLSVCEEDTPYQFPVIVEDLKKAIRSFCEKGIQVEQCINLPLKNAVDLGCGEDEVIHTQDMHLHIISLPVHDGLNAKMIANITNVLISSDIS